MTRISKTFDKCKAEKRNALVIYVTMGCPDLDTSECLVMDIINAGADIISIKGDHRDAESAIFSSHGFEPDLGGNQDIMAAPSYGIAYVIF